MFSSAPRTHVLGYSQLSLRDLIEERVVVTQVPFRGMCENQRKTHLCLARYGTVVP